jgi:hypothetical protein
MEGSPEAAGAKMCFCSKRARPKSSAQAVGNGAGNRQHLGQVQHRLLEPAAQGLPFEQLHDCVGRFLVRADVENGKDVGVGQCRHHFDLALESPQRLGVPGHGLGQDLDGHVAFQPAIARTVDLAHAAGAELADNFIRAQNCSR